MSELEKRQVDEVIEDLIAFRPVVVVVDDRTDKQAFGKTQFDFLTYFLRDPRFAQAWRAYEYRGNVEKFAVFGLRTPTAGD
jgi:hypothetical protein